MATVFVRRLLRRSTVTRFTALGQPLNTKLALNFCIAVRLTTASNVVGQVSHTCPSLRNPFLVARCSSTVGERHWADIYLEELEDIVDNKDAVLIDVREPWELETFGSFPDAVNIPLGEVHDALQMTEEDFQSKYSRGKPSADDKIVMYCMGGIRSRRALNSALSLGYNKARHYIGGWEEWSEKILKKPILR